MFIGILKERVLGEVHWWIREGGVLCVTVFCFFRLVCCSLRDFSMFGNAVGTMPTRP